MTGRYDCRSTVCMNTQPTPTEILAAHRAALDVMLSMNAHADVDRPGRLILDNLDAKARSYQRRIERAEADLSRAPGIFDSLARCEWGVNDRGPAIASICRQAEVVRAMGLTQSTQSRKAA